MDVVPQASPVFSGMEFYTLIYVSEGEELPPNAPAPEYKSQIGVYLGCARSLHRSLAIQGLRLTVLTNDRAYLEQFDASTELSIRQLDFTLEVPLGITHRTSHFRFELFSYLSALPNPYVALVDCDSVQVNPFPPGFETIVQEQIALYYDITDQMTPALGAETIIRDKELVGRERSFGLWVGGEFLAGPPSFFRALAGEVRAVVGNYFSHLAELSHESDEVVTSVAIEKLVRGTQLTLVDAGHCGIVARHWGRPTMHVQKPLAGYYDHALLHLPYDKGFLCELRPNELRGTAFFDRYGQHLSQSTKRGGRQRFWSRMSSD